MLIDAGVDMTHKSIDSYVTVLLSAFKRTPGSFESYDDEQTALVLDLVLRHGAADDQRRPETDDEPRNSVLWHATARNMLKTMTCNGRGANVNLPGEYEAPSCRGYGRDVRLPVEPRSKSQRRGQSDILLGTRMLARRRRHAP